MITGAHLILYSKDADADRAFLRDVLAFDHVDAGRGWLIFALPPAEAAVHPADTDGSTELFLMTDDIEGFVREMTTRGVVCSDLERPRWGVLTRIELPSGARMGVYQPSHPTAI